MKKTLLTTAMILLIAGFWNWGLWLFSAMFFVGYIAAKNQAEQDRVNAIYRRRKYEENL
jgi:hypothetical protein